MTVRSNLEKAAETIATETKFLSNLESELGNIISDLKQATIEDALEICKDVAERLNAFYQPL